MQRVPSSVLLHLSNAYLEDSDTQAWAVTARFLLCALGKYRIKRRIPLHQLARWRSHHDHESTAISGANVLGALASDGPGQTANAAVVSLSTATATAIGSCRFSAAFGVVWNVSLSDGQDEAHLAELAKLAPLAHHLLLEKKFNAPVLHMLLPKSLACLQCQRPNAVLRYRFDHPLEQMQLPPTLLEYDFLEMNNPTNPLDLSALQLPAQLRVIRLPQECSVSLDLRQVP